MSNISLPDNAGRVNTFTRQEGPDTVHMQAVVPVDPATGNPLSLAQEATLAALNTAVATLNTAAAAIQSAVEALNAKTTAVNTDAIAGAVALDAATLQALETVNANTGLAQPLTDVELRAAPVPVAVDFPATQQVTDPALASVAQDATVQAINALNDTMVTLLAAIFEKMPRVTSSNQAAISIEAGAVSLNANQTLQTVGNQNAMGGKFISGDNQMLAGCAHLYNHILVS